MDLDALLKSIREEGTGGKIVPAKFFSEDKYDKYYTELISEGRIDGDNLSANERKNGVKEFRKGKQNFKSFVDKLLNRKQQVSSPVGNNIPDLEGSIVIKKPSIDPEKVTVVNTEIIDDYGSKLDDLIDEVKTALEIQDKTDVKKEEKEKRNKEEKRLESKYKKLQKTTTGFLKPVKSILDRILDFFINIILGRIVVKFVEWLGNPKNKSKVNSIIRFLTDFGPKLIGAYLVFGTSIGKGIRKLSRILIRGGIRIAAAAALMLKKVGILKGLGMAKFLLGPKGAIIATALEAIGTAAAVGGLASMLSGGGDKPENDVQGFSGGGQVEQTQQQQFNFLNPFSYFSGQAQEAMDQADRGEGNFDTSTPVGAMMEKRRKTAEAMQMLRGFNQGSLVSGPGGVDKVPAMLTAGEFVMSRGAVQKFGVDTMMSMNAMGGGTNIPTMMGGKIYAKGGGPALTKEQYKLLDAISAAEGTSASYGTVYGGKVVPELAQGKMTIAQVLQMMDTGIHPTTGEKLFASDKHNSDATGRYQMMSYVLKEEAQKGGYDINKTLFTPQLQDKIIIDRITEFRGVTPELLKIEGASDKVIDMLAPEFASFPNLMGPDSKGNYGTNSSYYGQGGKSAEFIREKYNKSQGTPLYSIKASVPTGPTISGTTGSSISGTTGSSVTKKPEGVTRVVGGIMDMLSGQKTDFDQRGSFNFNILPFMEQKESNVKTITKPRVVAPPPPIKRQPKVSVINGETTQQMASVSQAVTRVPELPAPPMSSSKVKLLGISIPV